MRVLWSFWWTAPYATHQNFKNPINQRASQMRQIHTSYFVNAQNYDFSNRNRVGPGPISTYETHTQSHITICLIRCKISSVSYKNKQADPGCPESLGWCCSTIRAVDLKASLYSWCPLRRGITMGHPLVGMEQVFQISSISSSLAFSKLETVSTTSPLQSKKSG